MPRAAWPARDTVAATAPEIGCSPTAPDVAVAVAVGTQRITTRSVTIQTAAQADSHAIKGRTTPESALSRAQVMMPGAGADSSTNRSSPMTGAMAWTRCSPRGSRPR